MVQHADIDHTGLTGVGGGIPATIVDAKGDIIAATAADTVARVAVGANGSSLRAASGASAGVEWQLNKYDATVAPAATDDSGDGYSVGSIWIDVTGDDAYICVDASVGAAVWNPFDAGGGGGSVFSGFPIDEPPGSPHADDEEFNTSGTASWTAEGRTFDTLAAHDTGSGYDGLLHGRLNNNTSGSTLACIVKTLPSLPCTITTSVMESTARSNFCRGGGLVLLPSGTTAAFYWGIVYNGGKLLQSVLYSGLSGFSSSPHSLFTAGSLSLGPWRLRFIINSTSSIDVQVSEAIGNYFPSDNDVWRTIAAGYNPGFTIARGGLAMSTEGNADLDCLWDYYRVE